MQRRLGLAFATGLMQLVSTVYSVELPCYRRYFGTQGRNQDVIKWEEQMTELWETVDCADDDDDGDGDDIEKNIQMQFT